MSSLQAVLYRALLRTAREFKRREQPLRVRLPLHRSRSQWLVAGAQAQYEHITAERAAESSVLEMLFPGLQHPPKEDAISPERLVQIIALELRAPVSADALPQRLDNGIAAMREMHAQLSLARCSSAARSDVGDDVCVECEAHSMFRGQSGPHWAFQYRIRITNKGSSAVQVLGRQWTIRNADGSMHAEVARGSPGVVGQTPVLQPGEAFEYSSGSTVATPGGSVEGSFQ